MDECNFDLYKESSKSVLLMLAKPEIKSVISPIGTNTPTPRHLSIIPIYNFHGRFLMPMRAAIAFMIGRYFYKKSGYKKAIGYCYPIAGAIAALGLLFSPLSSLLIDATYPSAIGSVVECYTLILWIIVGFTGIVIWRFRMKQPLDFHDEWPIIGIQPFYIWWI